MIRPRFGWAATGLLLLGAGARTSSAQADNAPVLEPPAVEAKPDAPAAPLPAAALPDAEPQDQGRAPAPAAFDANPALVLQDDDKAPVRPLVEGPLHEAFLSPAKDGDPARVAKAPPAPITERPGVDRPSPDAQWIPGYWQWDARRTDFTWVTGTWRVPPPGRFWVDGFWKRDDQGWYRVAGFWSDRQTDRIDWRKDGPPADRPEEKVTASPGEGYFYIPGQYAPDGDGVAWKPGFWTKAQPGWSWVPAQWVKQPQGYAYQDGYWDRTLEDRGTLFAPAQVADTANAKDLVYQPIQQVAPGSYDQLNGAFGRPNTYYDGYPGVSYDPSGNYYGYAGYGNIGLNCGYLDYPYSGGYGYPYLTSAYGQPFYNGGGYGYGYGGGLGGFGLGYGGIGLFGSLLNIGYGGFGYGGLGYRGLGYGGYGFGGLGYGVLRRVRRPGLRRIWPGLRRLSASEGSAIGGLRLRWVWLPLRLRFRRLWRFRGIRLRNRGSAGIGGGWNNGGYGYRPAAMGIAVAGIAAADMPTAATSTGAIPSLRIIRVPAGIAGSEADRFTNGNASAQSAMASVTPGESGARSALHGSAWHRRCRPRRRPCIRQPLPVGINRDSEGRRPGRRESPGGTYGRCLRQHTIPARRRRDRRSTTLARSATIRWGPAKTGSISAP